MKTGIRILTGKFKGRVIPVKGSGIRPATAIMKKRIFDILRDSVKESHVLDLFAGTGSLSFEAISRGARRAELVERNLTRINVLKSTVEKWGIESQIDIYSCDVLKWLNRFNCHADIIFVDPPYKYLYYETLSELISRKMQKKSLIIWHCSDNLPVLDFFSVVRKLKQGGSTIYLLELPSS
ncbi:MAG: RsmD family RNA methyltransferase [bacterium]